MSRGHDTDLGGPGGTFAPTAWTRILQAREGSTSDLQRLLDHLISLYWKPIYFHIRRKGHQVEDAKDLTQQFFALFLQRDLLQKADRAKGKFRTYLLTAVDRFLCDDFDKRTAQKRTPTLDFARAEPQFYEDCSFERDWALVVLDRAFSKLKELAPREAQVLEAQRAGKTRYRELAESMGLNESHLKVLAHRGRTKLRALLLEELSQTVVHPGDEVEELADLFRAFSL